MVPQHHRTFLHILSSHKDRFSFPEVGMNHTRPHGTLVHKHASHNSNHGCNHFYIENPSHNTLSPPPPSHIGTYTHPSSYKVGTPHHDKSHSIYGFHSPTPYYIAYYMKIL
uniref:Uncharacterized protein n=1 Tax=Opuntia streptacantha TaxID=393608 RepID=A0A7C9AR12_OPUST